MWLLEDGVVGYCLRTETVTTLVWLKVKASTRWAGEGYCAEPNSKRLVRVLPPKVHVELIGVVGADVDSVKAGMMNQGVLVLTKGEGASPLA